MTAGLVCQKRIRKLMKGLILRQESVAEIYFKNAAI